MRADPMRRAPMTLDSRTRNRVAAPLRKAGFTLIELMIAVTILAIVAGVAMPLYNAYADRSYRAEAQADLMACAQGMERWASENFDYLGAADGNGDGAPDADAGAVSNVLCTPRSVDQGRYNITVTGTASGFTLRATPLGAMAGDGFMTYDDAGNRMWDQDNSGSIGTGEDSWEEH